MEKKPSNYTSMPMDSVLQKLEPEIVAQNIMKILAHKRDDQWISLHYDEYETERLADGDYSEGERHWFNKVIGYCNSPDTADLFCEDWYKETTKQHQ